MFSALRMGVQMRGSKHDLPVALEARWGVSRQAEWGKLSVALEAFRAQTDTSAVLRGLPGDRCPCPHWGYVIAGRMRVRYREREELIVTGEAYYLAPGHARVYEEDTELVEFSPKGQYQATFEVVMRNMAESRLAAITDVGE